MAAKVTSVETKRRIKIKEVSIRTRTRIDRHDVIIDVVILDQYYRLDGGRGESWEFYGFWPDDEASIVCAKEGKPFRVMLGEPEREAVLNILRPLYEQYLLWNQINVRSEVPS